MSAKERGWRFPQWLAAVGMGLLSFGLVVASGWWYTTARRPYLSTQPTAISTEGAISLEVSSQHREVYGVLSAAQVTDGSGRPSGYVVTVARQGYKSSIKMQCTFTGDGQRLAGLKILSQDETDYLGSRITSESFTSGFAGRLLPVKLWASATVGSPVDGLTGSTVSAQAVVDGVNGAHAFIQEYMTT